MHDPNQAFPGEESFEPPNQALPPTPPRTDLRPWFLIVSVVGFGALLMGHAELAAFTVLAGLFAVAHAADVDPARSTPYRAVAWVVPVGSAMAFGSLGFILWTSSDLPTTQRTSGLAVASLGAIASLVIAYRPAAQALARFLFGTGADSSVDRLAARIAVLGVLFTFPARLAFPVATEQLTRDGDSLVGGAAALWSNLMGLVLLGLGAVGFAVRRDFRATLDRLGVAPIRPAQWTVILLGLTALIAVNAVAEWAQSTWFPELWASDQRINRMIVGTLTRPEILLLGLSAGVGEELSLRGALQPRLGVLRTSLFFALLHVQYSWFGMGIIAVLGLFLGWIRRKTSTSVAIVVHSLYDVAAVLTLK
jgi:hypothetical protein